MRTPPSLHDDAFERIGHRGRFEPMESLYMPCRRRSPAMFRLWLACGIAGVLTVMASGCTAVQYDRIRLGE
ncbi:MAG: hypothetical protein D6744_11070, partial [Planctomycetota bacterium]